MGLKNGSQIDINSLTKDQAVTMLHDLQIAQSKADPRYWIEQFAYIEDRDSPTLAERFTLWPGQIIALLAFVAHRLNIALKARQLGLSWLALAYAAWMMWSRPGVSVIVMSRGEDESKEMTRRVDFILRHLPAWMIGTTPGNGMWWESTTSTVTIYHPAAEPSVLQSMPAGKNSGRSFTANLIILDEWAFQIWAREIWASIFPSINRPSGGQVIGISTIERGTLFEDIWTNAADNGFNTIFLPWNTDPRRDAAWYERTKRAMGDAVLAEYPATAEEAFATPGGSFFPELRETVHTVEPYALPEWHKKVIAFDYGMDMLACYWIDIDGQNRSVVYRELYRADLTISEAAEAIKKETGNERIETIYAPGDLWARRQDTGKSAADIFAMCGLPLYKAINDREDGWLAVHEALLPRETRDEQTGATILKPNLTIMRGRCPNLWRSMVAIQKDKHNPRDAAKQPHEVTHAPDGIRYYCASWTMPSVEPDRRRDDIGAWRKKPDSVTAVFGGSPGRGYL